jgi:hypothetical protein
VETWVKPWPSAWPLVPMSKGDPRTGSLPLPPGWPAVGRYKRPRLSDSWWAVLRRNRRGGRGPQLGTLVGQRPQLGVLRDHQRLEAASLGSKPSQLLGEKMLCADKAVGTEVGLSCLSHWPGGPFWDVICVCLFDDKGLLCDLIFMLILPPSQ